jgi:hypothetical protein
VQLGVKTLDDAALLDMLENGAGLVDNTPE